MRFDLVPHEYDALLSMIATEQRYKALIEDSDATRRQTAKHWWLLRGLTRRELLLTNTIHALAPRSLV